MKIRIQTTLSAVNKVDEVGSQEKPKEYRLVKTLSNPVLRFLTSGSSRNWGENTKDPAKEDWLTIHNEDYSWICTELLKQSNLLSDGAYVLVCQENKSLKFLCAISCQRTSLTFILATWENSGAQIENKAFPKYTLYFKT